jgi:hypothetical protein
MARGKSQPTDYALSYGGHRLPVVAVLTREYWLFGPVGVSNRTARPAFDEYIFGSLAQAHGTGFRGFGAPSQRVLSKRDSKAAQQVVPEAPMTMPSERPAVMLVGGRV